MMPEVTSERPRFYLQFGALAAPRPKSLSPGRTGASPCKELRNGTTYNVREAVSEPASSAADRRQASTNAQREVPKPQCPGRAGEAEIRGELANWQHGSAYVSWVVR